MKNEDSIMIKKMIKYCNDIETLLTRFHMDFEIYKIDISFQYSCNMCIIQIGELANRLSDEMKENNKKCNQRYAESSRARLRKLL